MAKIPPDIPTTNLPQPVAKLQNINTYLGRYAHFLPEAQQKASNMAAEIFTQQAYKSAEVVSLDDRRHQK